MTRKHVQYAEFERRWDRICFVARAMASTAPIEAKVVTERDSTGRIIRQYEVEDEQQATGYIRIVAEAGFTRWLRRIKGVAYNGPGKGFWISANDLGLIPTGRVPHVTVYNHVAGLKAASGALTRYGIANDVWIRYF